MAKKKNTIPSDIDNILGSVYGSPEGSEGVSNMDDIMAPDVPLEEDDTNEPPVNSEEDNVANQVDPIDNPIDEPPVDEPSIDNPTDDNDDVDDNIEDVDTNEAQQVSLLFDAVGESLGWDMTDIDEETKPKDVNSLVKYLSDIVTENSVPKYADENVQALDEYVKNGGKFEDFYKMQQESFNLDNVDLEDESDQKAVVKQLMKYNGYTDEQIAKRVSRFEEADMLYEESEDALDRLKHIKQLELEQAQKEQEAYAAEQREKSKQFFDSVSTQINSLTNVRGIAIPKEDRRALFDYIFKVDQNGKSQYAKDFEKNLSKNLIESAYFTMKADALISSAKRTGETSAAQKLQKALRHTTKNHTVYNADEKQRSVTDIVNGLF